MTPHIETNGFATTEVLKGLTALTEPGQIFELRACGDLQTLDGKEKAPFRRFTNPTEAAEWSAAHDGKFQGLYFMLNPIRSGMDPSEAAKDIDIVRRTHLLIDCDPTRKGTVSATAAELEKAERMAVAIRTWLKTWECPDPIFAGSGNGGHLVYRIDLPNDTEVNDLIRDFLRAVAKRFNTAEVKIDTKVYNASRVCKLYGTMACKGPDTPDRPHRRSRVSKIPDPFEVVPCGLLEAIAAEVKVEPKPSTRVETKEKPREDRPPSKTSIETRVLAYLDKCEPAISGENGHDKTFGVACCIGPGFDLSPDEAFRVLWDHYNPRCQPPWSEKELRHKIDDAYERETKRGFLLETIPQSHTNPIWVKTDQILGDGGFDPPDPLPTATLADVRKIIANTTWPWVGWLAGSALTALAADPGIGKTRFLADLLRRVWHGLPWPDGSPNPFPKQSRVIWVPGDQNFLQLLQLAEEFNVPDEAFLLNSEPDVSTGGLNLDDPVQILTLKKRIVQHRPVLAVVDTVGGTTERNLCTPEDAKAYFAPLREIAVVTGVSFLMGTHLSKEGRALGRRIEGACRVVWHLESPDQDNYPNRRKLYVKKTETAVPPPLGMTMVVGECLFDDKPPAAPGPSTGGRPNDASVRADEFLLERVRVAGNPAWKDLLAEWLREGRSESTLKRSRKKLVEAGTLVEDGGTGTGRQFTLQFKTGRE